MSSRSDHLVETAVRLFKSRGYHATGIDRILTEAGVAKMTLYNHFGSKDELIVAALRRWDEESRQWLIGAIEERASDPRGRLLALFDVLAEWCESPDFCGCMFINAAAEYPDPTDPIHRAAAEHKRRVAQYVRGQATDAGYPEPDALTAQLLLVMDGSIVTAQVSRQTPGIDPAAGRRTAEALLDRADAEAAARAAS